MRTQTRGAHTSAANWAGQFAAGPGYLSACTAGLPSDATVDAMQAFIARWAGGGLDARAISAQAERCRELFATIAGVAPARVALGSQISQLVSIVATAVPDQAEVLCATGDFASLTHPFEQLAARGVRVRYAPVSELAAAVDERTALVAFSLVQSASGEIADHAAIRAAAARVGARTLVDLTQSLGWLPVGAEGFDFTVCHAYKWLCAPRGTAFLTVAPGLDDELTPLAAGWCSADDVWSSCYAGHTPLAAGAGRFDVSPVWPAIAGTEVALRECTERDPAAVLAHTVGLANEARAMLGLPAGDSAIVTWADPDGADLAAMQHGGITASGRAGNARISFHLWNTSEDVAQLAAALGR
ncbi:aminotransferase class V-fold PLP-dependent enzyme [Leucobacter luti]|uniref:Selenocysteine lyase/cysteine desulfurase n=1 Tax=Leucobacter luti TaxID=340320 RepID=A0A4Q7U5G6_9MICO|nr:aminotransferase class V-fold PLP-dependent enzyme [Leucobacter luti]MBL3700886.1 aminotransferase class V-fold PLP-dependent enzyme [Leucobacter luti]RZT68896.1 selenocysteine lyase/cysteine desulfurase [Leucobacter luti]